MIVRTDAVVIRSMKYGETSRIATLLTRKHGLIGVMARGARRTKSRFGSTLQPMAVVQAVYYYKPERGLQTLKETSHLMRFPTMGHNLERLTLGLRAIEMIRALLQENEPQPRILDLLVTTLAHLDASPHRPTNALLWFELRLATLLGFAPDIQRDAVEAVGKDGGRLRLSTGTVIARGSNDAVSQGTDYPASRAALRAFAILARTDLDTALRMKAPESIKQETENLIDLYIKYQTDNSIPGRVHHVAGQLEAGLNQCRTFGPSSDLSSQ